MATPLLRPFSNQIIGDLSKGVQLCTLITIYFNLADGEMTTPQKTRSVPEEDTM